MRAELKKREHLHKHLTIFIKWFSDMNLLQYANITGGTFTFNIVNQE